MNYKTVALECGKYKYHVGQNGVTEIGLSAEQPGMWVIKFENGNIEILAPSDTFRAVQQEQKIIIDAVDILATPAA